MAEEIAVSQDASSSQQRRKSDASEREEDDFEDANDTTEQSTISPPASPERSRSLTQRRSSSTKSIHAEVLPHHLAHVPALPTSRPEDKSDEEEHASQPTKSPLLTSHRLSNASLDDIKLDDDAAERPANINSQHIITNGHRTESEHPPLPLKNTKSSFQGLSTPWSPPPQAPAKDTLPAPPPPTRKLTSPFSWLSRNTSQPKDVTPVPVPHTERRNTTSSIATVSSNPEMMLGKLDEGEEYPEGTIRPARNSLRDRFKLLRMREEAGITALDGDEDAKGGSALAGLIGRSASLGLGVASPGAIEEKELTLNTPLSPGPMSPHPLTINASLAPGTVSGVSAGPSAMADPEAPVDWDLWQSVVYEGPSVVAKTSPEDLNRAIATGIPNAIRGVVWQVLAHSKSEELEHVYRVLLNRGTDKEDDRMSLASATTSSTGTTVNSGKEEIKSSASSVHSDKSAALRSPSPPQNLDIVSRTQAAQGFDMRKRTKDDADSLKKLEKAIKRDMGARTSYSKFAASAGLQDGLFGVCKAYALFDAGVGYAQGMNFLIMPLLFNMPEEEAFSLLVKLMNQYHLRDLFVQDMPGLHKHLYQFERLLEDFEPALYCHLHRRQVTPHLYATQWFLTLFAYRFPLQLVLRIYDLILSEGLEAILKFGIVLMQKNADKLLKMNDMGALTTFLKDKLFDVYIDQAPSAGSILESGFFGNAGTSIDKEIYRADQLVQDACAVKITPEVLKQYGNEWEEKTRAEKEREAELESLRAANNTLTLKVRRLEERAQEHDTEHAALATDLVRTKVENEELGDENESLKTQVQELKIVIEKQPEEVEQRLQSEMDRLLKRNQEVHEENTRLEEDMSNMEQVLVETKMKYAEVNADHETLTRRFADMRRALGAA